MSAPGEHLDIAELERLFVTVGDMLDRVEPPRHVVVLTKAILLLADRIGDPEVVAEALRDAERSIDD